MAVMLSVSQNYIISGLNMLKVFIQNAGVTFMSRVLGFLRDILLAKYLGASWQMDAFLIVFKLPNFFRRLVAEGAFSQSLIPAVIKSKDSIGLMQQLYGGILVVVAFISLPFILFPHTMLRYLVYGFPEDSEVFIAASQMLPWVFPYLLFMVCCGFYTAQLNISKRYMVGSALPIVLNICLIIGGILYFHTNHMMWLSYAVFIAGLIQLLVCVIAVIHNGGVVLPRRPRLSKQVRKVLTQASSAFLAQVMTYFSSLFDLLIASFLATGSLSWLYYSERLAYLPVGVVSVVLANIVLPQLARSCQEKDFEGCRYLVNKASLIILLTGFPMMVGGLLLAHDIVSALFSSSSFHYEDVRATVASFQVMLLAMPAFMLNKVWGTVPFALSESRQQLKISLRSVVAGVFVTVVSFNALGHVAISLGGFAGAWTSFYLLYGYSKARIQYQFAHTEELKAIIQATAWMLLTIIILGVYEPISADNLRFQQFALLMGKILLGASSYVTVILRSRAVMQALYH